MVDTVPPGPAPRWVSRSVSVEAPRLAPQEFASDAVIVVPRGPEVGLTVIAESAAPAGFATGPTTAVAATTATVARTAFHRRACCIIPCLTVPAPAR